MKDIVAGTRYGQYVVVLVYPEPLDIDIGVFPGLNSALPQVLLTHP